MARQTVSTNGESEQAKMKECCRSAASAPPTLLQILPGAGMSSDMQFGCWDLAGAERRLDVGIGVAGMMVISYDML